MGEDRLAPIEKSADFYLKFIEVWWEAQSIKDVCTAFNIDKRDASNIAAHLRRKSIPMKNIRSSKRFGKIVVTPQLCSKLYLLACKKKDELEARKQREKLKAYENNIQAGVVELPTVQTPSDQSRPSDNNTSRTE